MPFYLNLELAKCTLDCQVLLRLKGTLAGHTGVTKSRSFV